MLALIHFALLLHLLLGQYLSSASDTVHVVTAENSNIPSPVPSHSPVAPTSSPTSSYSPSDTHDSPSSTVSALSQLSSCVSSSCSSFFKPGDEDFSTDYAPLLLTFKIVGDNIDKHIKPREMRMDLQAKDMHYFNLYAVRDRVDVSICYLMMLHYQTLIQLMYTAFFLILQPRIKLCATLLYSLGASSKGTCLSLLLLLRV